MSNLSHLIKEAYGDSGEHVEGRLFTEDEFIAAVDEILANRRQDGGAAIDAMGRIYVEGDHVGWVKRDAGLVELKALAEAIGCNLPSLDAMLPIIEGGSNA